MAESHTDLCEITMVGDHTHESLVSPLSCPSLALYGIILAGISYTDGDFRFVRHKPLMTQLMVCFGGAGEVLVDGEWHRCEKGMAYLTPPGVLHAYHSLPVDRLSRSSWQVCWVKYTYDGQSGPATQTGKPALIQVDGGDLKHAIESLHRETKLRAEAPVLQSWSALVHAYAQRAIATPSRLAAVWRAVNNDLSRPWTLDDLAHTAGLSPEHLRRICHSELNCSPMRYVTELRMREAAMMLTSGFYSVETVASRVGYDNAFAFSTAFKRHTGTAPSQYRRIR